MGVVISMDSKKFLNKFIQEVEDPMKYEFVLISDYITTKDKFKNVKAISSLMPTPKIIAQFLENNMKEYKRQYLSYLQTPDNEALLAIIVKAAVEKDMKIVLICSHSEDELEYISMLCEYIEAVFKLKTYSYKKYMKDPDKALKVKNKDEIKKILAKKFEKAERQGVRLDTESNKERYLKELKKLGKKGMKQLAKARGVKIDKDLGTEKMAKQLLKKLLA